MSRSLWLALSAALLALHPAAAQAPLDIFGTHFGGTRTPVKAPQWWVSANFMLITEFDGRWEDSATAVFFPDVPELDRYDSLRTTAGYNYLTVGGQRVANNVRLGGILPQFTAVTYASSLHIGVTDDSWIQGAQNALHNFRGVTQIKRDHVSEGDILGGVDAQVLVWPQRKGWAIGGQGSLTTFHKEAAVTAVTRIIRPFGVNLHHFRLNVAATKGWIWNSVKPERVAARLDDSYWSVRVSVEHADAFGLSWTRSSGIFKGEDEDFISAFFSAQLGATSWLRFEFVNDIVGNKDRGPTGGVRIAYGKTY